MKPDKIYIVHYTKLKDRYNHISNFFDSCKIPYEFILDNDQEDLTPEILDQYYTDYKIESSAFNHISFIIKYISYHYNIVRLFIFPKFK
jgi:hypothetical protein